MKARLFLLLLVSTMTFESMAEEVDYKTVIKPLLAEKCNACHGALKHESDLRLDAGKLILAGSSNGLVVKRGSPADSILIERIVESDPDQRMPPEGSGEQLSPSQVNSLREWIAQGAIFDEHETIPGDPHDHWAYQNPQKSTLPNVESSIESNPIDSMIRDKHRLLGLQAVERADRYALLRRLHFDLIGLPPSREQLEDFVGDDSPDAWRHKVDELLASPQYGERWGRHWMDVWRYSDWDGYKQELRGSQRHIWHWRDWIIDSLNSDKSYDEMIIEMLAADELPANTRSLAATGFLARNYHKSNRNIWLDATVEHTAKAFLGMTLNCARCHDHKFDPIPQQAYYEFRAIFEPHHVRTDQIPGQLDVKIDGLPRAFDADLDAKTYLFENGNEKKPLEDVAINPNVPEFLGGKLRISPVKLQKAAYLPGLRDFVVKEKRALLQQQLIDSERKLKELAVSQEGSFVAEKYAISILRFAVAALRVKSFDARYNADKVKAGENEDESPAENAAAKSAWKIEQLLNLKIAELGVAQKALALKLLQSKDSGDANVKTESTKVKKELAKAKEEFEAARMATNKSGESYTSLGQQYSRTSSGRRLALARWIASPENPLTARVAVNQIWMRHFGKPLVDNVFDFGLRSPEPEHLELLDWLAVELMENRWSLKHIHRLIVNSETWRQATSPGQGNENYTDVAENNRKIDPENEYLWRMNARRLDAEIIRDNVLAVSNRLDLKMGGPDIDFRKGEVSRRRSIYLRHAYEKQNRLLVLFDAANPNDCYRRSEAIIPQQALALVNSSICLDNARLLARQLSLESQNENEQDIVFVTSAFLQILARPPNQLELESSLEFLCLQTELLSNSGGLEEYSKGSSPVVPPDDEPELRAKENLVHVLMNHNDFLTVR